MDQAEFYYEVKLYFIQTEKLEQLSNSALIRALPHVEGLCFVGSKTQTQRCTSAFLFRKKNVRVFKSLKTIL